MDGRRPGPVYPGRDVVEGYTLRPLADDERHILKRALAPDLTDRIPEAADFATVYMLHGFGGVVSSMLLAAIAGVFDRSWAVPVLWTALPLLGIFGLYLGHRRWRVKRQGEAAKLDDIHQLLERGEVYAKNYDIREALAERLPNSAQIDVLALADSGEVLWMPAAICPQQGKQVNRASTKIDILRGSQGQLLAVIPTGMELGSALLVEKLAPAVESAVDGDFENALVQGVNFEALKQRLSS